VFPPQRYWFWKPEVDVVFLWPVVVLAGWIVVLVLAGWIVVVVDAADAAD
jgi:hypothetical protein